MLSVIIPTLWEATEINRLINHLNRIELVSEIIIFDNNYKNRKMNFIEFGNEIRLDYNINDSTGKKLQFCSYGKIIVITAENNLYVSEPWNLGVSIAKESIVCLLNDDTIPDELVFIYATEFINENKDSIGIVGIRQESYSLPETKRKFTLIKIRPLAFGCCMFILKSKYVTIPTQIKVWYNDDFLFYKGVKGDHYCFEGAKVSGSVSATINSKNYSSNLRVILENDKIEYNKII